jgi:hypothetical protein
MSSANDMTFHLKREQSERERAATAVDPAQSIHAELADQHARRAALARFNMKRSIANAEARRETGHNGQNATVLSE